MKAQKQAIHQKRADTERAARRKYEAVLDRCNAEMREARRVFDAECTEAMHQCHAELDALDPGGPSHYVTMASDTQVNFYQIEFTGPVEAFSVALTAQTQGCVTPTRASDGWMRVQATAELAGAIRVLPMVAGVYYDGPVFR